MTFTKKIKTNSGRQHGCYGAICPAVFIFSTGQYGEGQTDDKLYNLRGRPYKVYDGAGLTAIRGYDFKGNTLAQTRTYTEDATAHPDWTTIGSVDMEAETYETSTAHDALNRPVTLITPGGGKTNYTYDKSGLLKTVEVENVHSLDTDIVNNITYDAKGQREKIQYENGATTTYEYDTFTFRVRRIKTTRSSDNKVLQDLQYWYDPVGNITLQKDGALQAAYFDGTVATPDNDYTYDALYRLIQAEGREHAGNNQAPDRNDRTRRGISPIPVAATDTAKMRRYIDYYEYDAVGNFIEMQHTVTGGTGNWTRYYTTDDNSNRMLESVIGSGTPESYDYDARGNIISGFSHLQSLAYNAENRLEKVEINANITAYYQYDASGQRVRKTIVDTSSSTTETRKYIGEWEVYGKTVSSTLTLERETLHINDDTGRIALIDTRTTGSGTEPAQLLRYQYSNHLSTATLELDDAAAIISYEEYYPYGSTSFQSGRSGAEVSLKRYRYTGKERDEESGLYYHGARYYVPWLGRWSAVDTLADVAPGWSPYRAFYCNPIKYTDPTGLLESTDVVENKDGSYKVVDAKNDKDNNIYVVNNEKDKKRTGETIGTTMQPYDFMLTNDQTGEFKGHANISFSLDNLTVSGTVKPNDYTTSTINGADAQRLLNWGQELFRSEVTRQSPATFYGELEILREMSRNYLPEQSGGGRGSLDFKSSLELDKYTAISAGNTSDGKPIITTLRAVGNMAFGANMRSTKPYLLGSPTWYYGKVMAEVGAYNQGQNEGKGYNQGFPYFGEHTYSGSYIHYGFFGQFYKK